MIDTEELVESLCIALRKVGVCDYDLPDGEEAKQAISRVQQIDAQLQTLGVALESRLVQLSQETNWQMNRLLQECRTYPAVIPYVCWSNGVRRVYACAFCYQREVKTRGKGEWCEVCQRRQAEDRVQRRPVEESVLTAYLESVVAALHYKDVLLDAGLTETELTAAEELYHFRFSPDLRIFLQIALPISPGFPNWRRLDQPALLDQLNWPVQQLHDWIQEADQWQVPWDPRPPLLNEPKEVATQMLQQAPRLVPVFRRCYLPSEPPLAGNPVLSVAENDTFYAGFDLAGFFASNARYFANNFLVIPLPDWAAREPRFIPFWSQFGEGQEE